MTSDLHGRHTDTVTEPEPDEYELYDLTLDPIEERNLAHPSHADDRSRALQQHDAQAPDRATRRQAAHPFSRRDTRLPAARDPLTGARRLDGLEGAVDARHEVVLAEDVDGPAATQRVAHTCSWRARRSAGYRARRGCRGPTRSVCAPVTSTWLTASKSRTTVPGGGSAARTRARRSSWNRSALAKISSASKRWISTPGIGVALRVVLEVAEARAVAAAPERGDVRVVDRVDQQDEAEGDADRDARKDVDEDHAEQGAERRPELE